MQPLHKVVLELPVKVIMEVPRLAQISVNLAAEVALVQLVLMVFMIRLKVEMAELDWFHLFQAHPLNMLVAEAAVNFSILEVME
jgi:hypothetical protein